MFFGFLYAYAMLVCTEFNWQIIHTSTLTCNVYFVHWKKLMSFRVNRIIKVNIRHVSVAESIAL